jgi:hypothetical protein
MGFFENPLSIEEYESSDETNVPHFLSLMVLLLGLLFVLTNVGQVNPKMATIIQIFIWMDAIAMCALVVDRLKENRFVRFNGWGENFSAFMIAGLAGIASTFVALIMKVVMPRLSPSFFQGLESVTIGFLDNLAAPFAEEAFFGGFLAPTITSNVAYVTGNEHIGLAAGALGSATLFGLMHLLVFGADLGAMFAGFLLRILITYFNAQFQSTGYGLGLHLTFNLFNG